MNPIQSLEFQSLYKKKNGIKKRNNNKENRKLFRTIGWKQRKNILNGKKNRRRNHKHMQTFGMHRKINGVTKESWIF